MGGVASKLLGACRARRTPPHTATAKAHDLKVAEQRMYGVVLEHVIRQRRLVVWLTTDGLVDIEREDLTGPEADANAAAANAARAAQRGNAKRAADAKAQPDGGHSAAASTAPDAIDIDGCGCGAVACRRCDSEWYLPPGFAVACATLVARDAYALPGFRTAAGARAVDATTPLAADAKHAPLPVATHFGVEPQYAYRRDGRCRVWFLWDLSVAEAHVPPRLFDDTDDGGDEDWSDAEPDAASPRTVGWQTLARAVSIKLSGKAGVCTAWQSEAQFGDVLFAQPKSSRGCDCYFVSYGSLTGQRMLVRAYGAMTDAVPMDFADAPAGYYRAVQRYSEISRAVDPERLATALRPPTAAHTPLPPRPWTRDGSVHHLHKALAAHPPEPLPWATATLAASFRPSRLGLAPLPHGLAWVAAVRHVDGEDVMRVFVHDDSDEEDAAPAARNALEWRAVRTADANGHFAPFVARYARRQRTCDAFADALPDVLRAHTQLAHALFASDEVLRVAMALDSKHAVSDASATALAAGAPTAAAVAVPVTTTIYRDRSNAPSAMAVDEANGVLLFGGVTGEVTQVHLQTHAVRTTTYLPYHIRSVAVYQPSAPAADASAAAPALFATHAFYSFRHALSNSGPIVRAPRAGDGGGRAGASRVWAGDLYAPGRSDFGSVGDAVRLQTPCGVLVARDGATLYCADSRNCRLVGIDVATRRVTLSVAIPASEGGGADDDDRRVTSLAWATDATAWPPESALYASAERMLYRVTLPTARRDLLRCLNAHAPGMPLVALTQLLPELWQMVASFLVHDEGDAAIEALPVWASLERVYAIATTPSGALLATSSTQLVEVQPQRPGAPPHTLCGSAKSGNRDGPPLSARLGMRLEGLAVSRAEQCVYVADTANGAIRRVPLPASYFVPALPDAWTRDAPQTPPKLPPKPSSSSSG